MSEKTLELLSVICFILLLITALMVAQQRDELKQQAVDKGFAEWHIISGTKETEFKWKEPQKP
jgi:hypothetical protein